MGALHSLPMPAKLALAGLAGYLVWKKVLHR